MFIIWYRQVLRGTQKQRSRLSDDWFLELISSALSEADVDWSRLSDQEVSNLVQDFVEQSFPEVAEIVLKQLHSNAKSMLKDRRKFGAYSGKQIQKIWGRPLDLLEMLVVIAEEVGDKFNNRHRPQAAKENNIVFEALTRIHARACQIGFEVLTLLRQGFSDGAHARWRVLHELAVVAYFIGAHDDDLAERYLLHDAVESYKALNEYQRHYERLGYEAPDLEELDELRKIRDDLRDRYGDSYLTSYGWAAKHLGNANPSFSQLERAVNLEHWRPFYRLASHNVHANPKGLYFRLGVPENLPLDSDGLAKEILPTGSSLFGLTDPGHSTAISLTQVTSTLLNIQSADADLILGMYILDSLVRQIGDAFLQVDPDLHHANGELEEEK
jgi:hypothetical protein